jgi:hypothetical protein
MAPMTSSMCKVVRSSQHRCAVVFFLVATSLHVLYPAPCASATVAFCRFLCIAHIFLLAITILPLVLKRMTVAVKVLVPIYIFMIAWYATLHPQQSHCFFTACWHR